ncbi:hypothetical protein CBO05C_2841 [Clostridium botulinum B str. Osaka05]|uniref:Uncharacterized protein n=1 Tax=Clostridium botulinum B str. Osaka05 TaxID=1407017 RepID=A0A0S6U7N4_CLOBO|nr:hypothetical protein CBO05C_2841 [Clostridium botulinum B str. Osaka05]
MQNKNTNHIVSIHNQIYNYLNNVRHKMNKPQFHHLTNILNGLINLSGTKSL